MKAIIGRINSVDSFLAYFFSTSNNAENPGMARRVLIIILEAIALFSFASLFAKLFAFVIDPGMEKVAWTIAGMIMIPAVVFFFRNIGSEKTSSNLGIIPLSMKPATAPVRKNFLILTMASIPVILFISVLWFPPFFGITMFLFFLTLSSYCSIQTTEVKTTEIQTQTVI